LISSLPMIRNWLLLLFALLVMSPARADTPPLSVSLTTGKSIYRLGETIGLTLVATNDSQRTFSVVFPSAKRYDFAVYDVDNNLVWRWSADRMFTQALTALEIKPGENAVFTADWQQQESKGGFQVPDGDYTLKGAILHRAGVNYATCKISIVK
jgi:hypothetical protein